jgi:hypothetical protein
MQLCSGAHTSTFDFGEAWFQKLLAILDIGSVSVEFEVSYQKITITQRN